MTPKGNGGMRRARRRIVGTTLLEVLIALVIFSVGTLGVLSLVLSSIHLNLSSRYFTEANLVAQWQMDRVAVSGVNLGLCGDADGCFANGATLVASNPQTVSLPEIMGAAGSGAR